MVSMWALGIGMVGRGEEREREMGFGGLGKEVVKGRREWWWEEVKEKNERDEEGVVMAMVESLERVK